MQKHQALLFKFEGPNVKSTINKHDSLDPIRILDQIQEKNTDYVDMEEIIFEDINIGMISNELKRKLEEFTGLCSLGFNRCNLTSLNNLPALNIQRFTADGNHLKTIHLSKLLQYKLKSLSLMCNQLEQTELLSIYLKSTQIQQLNLYGNVNISPIDLFEVNPSLIIIDNMLESGMQLMYDSEDWNDLCKQDGYINPDLKVYEKE